MSLPSVLLVGTGEYTTGLSSQGTHTQSDKKAGVVALVFAHLQSRGKIGHIALAGTSGHKMPAIRQHLQDTLAQLYKLDLQHIQTFPHDDVDRDTLAYIKAMDTLAPGDLVSIFTPDDTHFDITMAAIQRGLHVILTKPPVKTLREHQIIAQAAKKHNVLVLIEVHKRYDPVYNDAKNRIQKLGDFSYFTSYMSQPKFQLETFKSWAGKSSDISFYLNSHHVDFHLWAVGKFARPVRVFASCSTGVAKEKIGVDTEDTITLTVEFENMESGNKGTASYTSSWSAPKSDVHSQQRFFYMGHKGEVNVDQAHRGYTLSTDQDGFGSVNPLYMRYTPDEQGKFCGQYGYGYLSFEVFVDAVEQIRSCQVTDLSEFDKWLPTAASTLTATAVLEAGRKSLDLGGMPMNLEYDASGTVVNIVPAYK